MDLPSRARSAAAAGCRTRGPSLAGTENIINVLTDLTRSSLSPLLVAPKRLCLQAKEAGWTRWALGLTSQPLTEIA